MIPVTKSFLPKQEEYQKILKKSWDKNWITNRGELVLELERKIKEKYSISNIIATTNGTLPLQISIKAMELSGEIITTPFSYIATASSIFWEGCKPVFADIEETSFNIDPKEIEAKITKNTSAVLATHVFGNPCDVNQIESIAKKYGLKVIYDAAHAFGVEINGKSIFESGDVSTCSFHATKIFHTGEGGGIFTKDKNLHDKFYYHHNFGHNGQYEYHGLGVNAKMSELQAAMGLAVFPYLDEIFESRKIMYIRYLTLLKENESLGFQKIMENTKYNFAYFPVVFESENQLLKVLGVLNQKEIFPRRYFYPSLNTIDYLMGEEMPKADFLSRHILCLPLYHDLKFNQIDEICELINRTTQSF